MDELNNDNVSKTIKAELLQKIRALRDPKFEITDENRYKYSLFTVIGRFTRANL